MTFFAIFHQYHHPAHPQQVDRPTQLICISDIHLLMYMSTHKYKRHLLILNMIITLVMVIIFLLVIIVILFKPVSPTASTATKYLHHTPDR